MDTTTTEVSSSPQVVVHCNDFLSNGDKTTINETIAVIVLNRFCDTRMLETLWNKAEIRMCADGGANHLYDLHTSSLKRDQMIPEYIKGDMDSIRPDVASYYGASGTQLIRDSDQETNDLDKCFQTLQEIQDRKLESGDTARFTVVIFGAFGGRVDQEMANINVLFVWEGKFHRIVLLSSYSLGFLLCPGAHEIRSCEQFEGPTCGLIPIAGVCDSVTTRGLRWDMTGARMGFGGLISTSNAMVSESGTVYVDTSHPILWTTVIRSKTNCDDRGSGVEEEQEDEQA